MQKNLVFSLLAAMLIIIGCNKEEGTGGEATIKGKIVTREYDPTYSVFQKEIPAVEEDVYIQYGNKEGVGDKVVTDLNGNYSFDYLLPGDYTIYIYSEDSTDISHTKKAKSVKISVKGSETATVPTIKKIKTYDLDEGSGSITGRIWLINYKKNYAEIKDTALAQEVDVYLVYENHTVFDLRTRTHFDGTYEFPNLLNGKYTVYVYSEDKTGATQLIPVKAENIVISDATPDVTVADIYVEKE